MPTNVIMPQLGESVVDGTVSEWLKKVGETVHEYEPIVRISTDKVDSEIPSPAGGVLLAIYVNEGDTVNAGTVLCIIGQANEQGTSPAVQPNHAADSYGSSAPKPTAPDPEQEKEGYGGHVTPVVARMINEHKLNVNDLKGTGRDGRITKKDVLSYLEQRVSNKVSNPEDLPPWERPGTGDLFKPTVEYTLLENTPTPSPTPPTAPATPTPAPVVPPPVPASGIPYEVVSISAMRRSIADHMIKSKQTSAHVTTVFEVDLGRVVAHRDANKDPFAKQGVKLTYTPYFILAIIEGLKAYPILNARWTEEGFHYHRAMNIGMATALEDGLIVPVLKNAQDYNLIGLARQVNDLAERARKKQLRPDEARDGTFTLTNHGITGSLFATPIINQPQAGILGVGAIEKRVKVINDAIAIRPCAYLSLTFDHRMIDGATGDGFLSVVKQTLENL